MDGQRSGDGGYLSCSCGGGDCEHLTALGQKEQGDLGAVRWCARLRRHVGWSIRDANCDHFGKLGKNADQHDLHLDGRQRDRVHASAGCSEWRDFLPSEPVAPRGEHG